MIPRIVDEGVACSIFAAGGRKFYQKAVLFCSLRIVLMLPPGLQLEISGVDSPATGARFRTGKRHSPLPRDEISRPLKRIDQP